MRDLTELEAWRDRSKQVVVHYGSLGDKTCGVFTVPSPIDGQSMRVIASAADGWDHVSISRRNRCPNWQEMEFIKRRFFKVDETAVQFHVPPSDHVNVHRYCLHLWRPIDAELPRPPSYMVG